MEKGLKPEVRIRLTFADGPIHRKETSLSPDQELDPRGSGWPQCLASILEALAAVTVEALAGVGHFNDYLWQDECLVSSLLMEPDALGPLILQGAAL
ncbi:hypothetical protein NDU88_007248 [Pleurodeles waltl]|uniref:Uncharacterized protein n=1 Tax=Pleurodeles waltl TaxID=8319 RepID=A0AAV7LRI6_PLEWA|nr:hypothetical protein NDU88_007248 [Pleurodeles waltl]